MKKVLRLGEAAIALALSATFIVAPVSGVNAKAWSQGTYSTEYKDPIDTLVTEKKLTQSVATSESHYADKAWLNLYNDAKNNGIFVDGTDINYSYSETEYDAAGNGTKKYFKLADGWKLEDKEDKTVNGIYTITVTFKKILYKNYVTGETSTRESALESAGNKTDKYGVPAKVQVYTGDVDEVYVWLHCGDTQIKNLKSSNKKVVQAKIGYKQVTTTTDSTKVGYKDEKGYYYYYNTSFNEESKIYVAEDTEVNDSDATYHIRLNAKKNGKAEISFDVYDINNKKTGSCKFTVVTGNEEPFKAVTFGGKSLIKNKKIGAADPKYIYAGKDSNTFYYYTTRKSGKFKVTPNKNIQIKKILVGTLKAKTTSYNPTDEKDYDDFNYETADYKSSYSASKTSSSGNKVDLNNDGDYDDVVNGIREGYVTFIYNKTIKNGKKVKLSKVPDYTSESYTNTRTNKADGSVKETKYSFSNKACSTTAPTSFKVIYYDKVHKRYGQSTFTVWKRISKY